MCDCRDVTWIVRRVLFLSSLPQRFRNSVNLLQQLSPDHTHPSLVVNLYSDERGYSLILNPGTYSNHVPTLSYIAPSISIDGRGEEIFMPYEVHDEWAGHFM